MSVFKEVNYVMKNIDAFSNGQVKIVSINEADDSDSESDSDDMVSIIIEIKPNASLYKGGSYTFKLVLSQEFPKGPPTLVLCLSPIYHPNIDMDITYETNVCLNILDSEEWHSSIGLTGCVIGLLYLLYNPELDDPLNSNYTRSTEEYENHVRKSLIDKNYFSDDVNTDTGICNENNQKVKKWSLQNEIDSLEQDMDTSDLSDMIKLVELIIQNNDIDDTNSEQNCDMQVCEDEVPNPRVNTLEIIPGMPHASVVPDVPHMLTGPNISSPIIPAMPHKLTDASNPSPLYPDMPHEFNGYKLTKHGTTFLPIIDVLQTPPLSFLIKRFTV